MGRHLKRTAVPVDGRAYDIGDKSLQVHGPDSVIRGVMCGRWVEIFDDL
jgi:hypothetical protein